MSVIDIKTINEQKQREDVFHFRLQVSENVGIAHSSRIHNISDPLDQRANILVSYEANQITGTLRSYSLEEADFEYEELCSLKTWLSVLAPEQISCTSKFMISGTKRKNRTVLELLKRHIEELRKKSFSLDIICSPEPSIPYYEWLGYRKFNKAFHHQSSPWTLTPMFFVLDDYDYLKKIRSPLMHLKANQKTAKLQKLNNFIDSTFSEENATPTAYIQLRHLANKYSVFFKNELMKPYINALQFQKYAKGETMFVKGQMGSSLHLIIEGSVKTEHRIIKTGEFFGESCLLSPGERSYTAIANSKLETLELKSEDFYSIIKGKPHTAPVILNLIGEKLRGI